MFFEGWDPSLYGMTRMLFGMLMAMDCFVERGLHYADSKWFDDGCKEKVSYFFKKSRYRFFTNIPELLVIAYSLNNIDNYFLTCRNMRQS